MGLSTCKLGSRGGAYLSIAALLLAACQAETTTTGVRLAIRYERAPERLRVHAHADDGSEYGPELLPDPPRALAARSESVLLQLPDALAGRTLVLEIEGLDANEAVMARGNARVRIVSGAILDSEVQLTPARGCSGGRRALADGGCAPAEVADAAPQEPSTDGSQSNPTADAGPGDVSARDAGPVDGGCGANCTDASRPTGTAPDTSVPDTGPPPVVDAGCAGEAARCGDNVCCAAAGEDRCSCA
ncbi:MAG TPA: hypothetical protein VK509_25350, partial [Polyangiales bacterium]|nr:hypothetical protein [Polyangiales bacterium]